MPPHRAQRLGRASLRGQAGGARLDHQARLVGRSHPAAIQVGDAGAAVGVHLHEPLRGEAPQRLAHRGPRDAELDGDVLLVDALPARERAGHDALADRLVGEVDDARHAEPLLGHRGAGSPMSSPLALPDREEVLEHAAALILETWRSFDSARADQPLPSELERALLAQPLPWDAVRCDRRPGRGGVALLDVSISQTRPRFFAWIGGSGLEIGVIADALMASHDVNVAVKSGAATPLEQPGRALDRRVRRLRAGCGRR